MGECWRSLSDLLASSLLWNSHTVRWPDKSSAILRILFSIAVQREVVYSEYRESLDGQRGTPFCHSHPLNPRFHIVENRSLTGHPLVSPTINRSRNLTFVRLVPLSLPYLPAISIIHRIPPGLRRKQEHQFPDFIWKRTLTGGGKGKHNHFKGSVLPGLFLKLKPSRT